MIGEGEVGGPRTSWFRNDARMALMGRICAMARSAGARTPGRQCEMIDSVAWWLGYDRGWYDARHHPADAARLIGGFCIRHGRKFS